MQKVVIFGAKGYLGETFLRVYPDARTPRIDIADVKAIGEYLDAEKPDVVINCAGKTGRPNVDWCEDHKEETFHANVAGPLILAEECIRRNIYLVHISSGCIYAGDGGGDGFRETDPPNFAGSFYSRTKAWSDQMLSEIATHGAGILLLRIRMPFDGTTNDRNLLMKLRKYSRVLDVANSLTYLPDFVAAAKTLIEKKKNGIYNVVNPGPVSPYRMMQLYKEIVDPKHTFELLNESGLSGVVKVGRSNCILNIDKLKGEGITMKSGEEAAREAMMALKGGA